MYDINEDPWFENYIANVYNCTVEEYWQRQRELELVDGGSDHWCEPDAHTDHPF